MSDEVPYEDQSAVEHLQDLLNIRNARIRELEEEKRTLENRIRGFKMGWMEHVELTEEQTLPVPRLEILIWQDEEAYPTHGWRYRLVYKHWTDDIVAVPLGHTTSSYPNLWPPRDRDGKLEPPRRDGFHIRCDANRLNLPAFIVAGDEVQVVEPFPSCTKCGEPKHETWLKDGECRACSPGRFP